ncbi:MAG: 2OG-Fe(II) oxygenase [Proteobacteria bacterium]|nr:2OG-Fe(II) oxygenase [Pseudomonadota bacterium]
MQLDVVVPGRGRPYLEGDSVDESGPLVMTIGGVLSNLECDAMIAKIEALGPTDAPITTAAGFEMRPEIRNNTRVMFDDHALAAALFARIAPVLPASLAGMRPVGANERFRGYRYEPGQRFAPHYDGCFRRNAHEESQLSLILYLDEGCVGGTTTFLDYDLAIAPKRGMALVFQHRLLHEGAEVHAGKKYVLRSDVMYARVEVA